MSSRNKFHMYTIIMARVLFQASLTITLVSGKSAKNKTDIVNIETTTETTRRGRQNYDQTYSNDNEVVVDIQDSEKNQYYETNYDTSEHC